ncbi:type VI secretion system-associated protein TagF [Roseibium sp. M-1]
MGSGYFGKLPARADFVIGRCPAGFLKVWEPFLVKGLAQSRLDLKDAWEEAYMTMPVWRFRLTPEGPDGALKEAVAGALMPSVDRVGRTFPLTLVAAIALDLPEGRNADGWYDQAEVLLRETLSEEAGFDSFQQAVDRFDGPGLAAAGTGTDADPDSVELVGGGEALQAKFWCRAGNRQFAFSSKGLPEPGTFHWFILPEALEAAGLEENAVGNSHGRSHPEDHRT